MLPLLHKQNELKAHMDMNLSQYYNVTPPLCLSSTMGTSDNLFLVGVVQIECRLPPIIHQMGSFRMTARSLPGKG